MTSWVAQRKPRAVIDAGLPSSAGALSVTRADHSNAIVPNHLAAVPGFGKFYHLCITFRYPTTTHAKILSV